MTLHGSFGRDNRENKKRLTTDYGAKLDLGQQRFTFITLDRI